MVLIQPSNEVPNVIDDDTSGLGQLASHLLVLVGLQGLDTCKKYLYLYLEVSCCIAMRLVVFRCI